MKKQIKTILFVGVLMLVGALAGNVTASAETSEIKYSGVDGKVEWSIDENGHLLLTGDGNYEGDPEWLNSDYCLEIKSATVKVKNMTNTQAMFVACQNLTSIDFSEFDTSKIKNMSYMFFVCSSLSMLDMSNFKTHNVTKMNSMFEGCSNLTQLDLSSFDTSSVTNMQFMFNGCSSLTSITLGTEFSTANVTNMYSMFGKCSGLTNLDLGSFDTSSVTNMEWMFNDCSSLTSITFGSKFSTASVTSMDYMFKGCKKVKSLDVSGFDTGNVTSMCEMFYSCERMESLDVSRFDTSNVENMSSMFSSCIRLTELDLGNWDFGSLKTASSMFKSMVGLVRITLADIPLNTELPDIYYDYKNNLTRVAKANQGKMTYILAAYGDSYCHKNGHTYSLPNFTWADDYSSAKVYFECTRKDCKFDVDDKHVQMDATVTKTVVNPTTEKEGATVYTATAVHKGKTYTDVKSVAIPKLPAQAPAAKPVGTSFNTSTTFYRVTKAGVAPELAYMGPKNKKVKKVTIPATVKIDGVTYKVTSVATGALKNYKKLTTVTIGKNVTKIGKNAFYGCKKLGKIVIKSKKLKTVGKNAFKGIKKNATIDVPNSKKKAYKKLLKAKTGYKKTMKIK